MLLPHVSLLCHLLFFSICEAELLTSLQYHNTGWYLMPGYPNELTEKTDTLTYLYAWTGGNPDNTMAVLAPDLIDVPAILQP